MIENQQKPRHGWSKVSPWLVVITIIIVSTLLVYQTGCNESEKLAPSPTVPPGTLQLTDMQNHTYGDMGISVSYPSDWEEIQGNSSSYVTLVSESVCMDVPLMFGVFAPVNISSMGLQAAIDNLTSLFIEKTGLTVVSNQSIEVNGIEVFEVIASDTESYGFEFWSVFILVLNDNGISMGNIVAYCRADCWEYYKPAVYTIASTYRFLE